MRDDNDQALAESFGTNAARLLEARGSASRFLKAEPASFPDDTWAEVAGQGWFRVLLPESDGGLGLGLSHLGAIFWAVGTHLLRGPLLDHAVTLPLLLPACRGRARDVVERALDGANVVVTAEAGEPLYGAGPIIFDSGRLTGTAPLVPFGMAARWLIVSATSPAGPSILLVGADRARLSPQVSLDPCVEYAAAQFDDLAIDGDDVLASGVAAERLLAAIRDTKRLMIAAELAGASQALCRMAVEYAKLRQQFGRTIGSFQALQHMLADLAARTTALGHFSAACLRDAEAEPARIGQIASAAKAYACKIGRYAAEETLQIHGGVGFTQDLPLHLYYRRILTYQGQLGETDELIRTLALNALAEARA